MGERSRVCHVLPDRAFSIALFSLAVTILSAVGGYYLACFLCGGTSFSLSVQSIDPYSGCDLFPEYAVRAARLCRPILLHATVLWLSPYTKFDMPLTSAIFIDRGISLGLSIRFCTAVTANTSLSLLPLLYALITSILILFAYSLRTAQTVRPFRDTYVNYLIASGFAFTLYIVSPWIL